MQTKSTLTTTNNYKVLFSYIENVIAMLVVEIITQPSSDISYWFSSISVEAIWIIVVT